MKELQSKAGERDTTKPRKMNNQGTRIRISRLSKKIQRACKLHSEQLEQVANPILVESIHGYCVHSKTKNIVSHPRLERSPQA